jgi:F-type H+-transporting ATPase subunit gamma
VASAREIRRRIRSVQNTSQITRAMEMVAAAKMRRAQQNVQASRPYSERIRTMISALSGVSELESGKFPLLEQRPVNRIGAVIITADKGLAGALNSNVIRRGVNFVRDQGDTPVDLVTVGRKGRDFFTRYGQNVTAEFTNMGDWPTIDDLRPIVDVSIGEFIAGNVDAVYLIYSQFVNVMVQRPVALQILPIQPVESEDAEEIVSDFIFEPSRDEVLEALLPRYIEVQLYQAMLEAIASEHSARMVAMRNASENAKELVGELSLAYNKARQTQITNEVSEIAAGAAVGR